MSVWNYVVTAQKPTAVTHSVVGNFTSASELNLIIAKCTRLEVHLLTPQGLKGLLDVPMYGRIATLELFRPSGEGKDVLFLSTERYKFCVLEYDAEAKALVTRAMGDVSDRIGRPTDNGQTGIVDPDARVIGLHLYDGLFKVIPIDSKGHLKEAFNIRLEELQVLDIRFLYGCEKPTIAVLYQDTRDARHVKTYRISMRDKDFGDGPWSQSNVESGAGMIIPVPAPLGGAIIVGEQTIMYHNGSVFKAIATPMSIVRAYGRVDADGSRYLLGDHMGIMHLLVLSHDKERVLDLKLEVLGETSSASTISYLDNGFVFVGSSYGDSQMIKLRVHPDEHGSYIEVVDSFVNLGSIVDFAIVDLEHQGQGQVVTCSGAFKDGSLRIVRNGIGINEQSTVELLGVKGMWSLRKATADEFDTFLVVTFVSETRVLAINDDSDEVEETEIPGFNSEAQTLLCCNTADNTIIQVTNAGLTLVDSTTLAQIANWLAPAGTSVNCASANHSQVVLATGGGNLVYLEIQSRNLVQTAHATLEHEIACVDCTPISTPPSTGTSTGAQADAEATAGGDVAMVTEGAPVPAAAAAALGRVGGRAEYVAVGMWTELSIRVLKLPSLELVYKESLGGEIIPRSVLFCTFETVPYLLCALGDGHLLNFTVDAATGRLSQRKRVLLGTQPIALRPFRSKGATHVFAASDRPTVIYSSNKKLLYSNVNLREVNHVCPFNTAAFPDSLALAKEDELSIGTIDDIQKLHIRTVPLREQARRITHHDKSRTLAVITVHYSPETEEETNYVRLFSDQTFDELSHIALDPDENGCSILTCSFADDPTLYVVVGTAYALPEEIEPSKGRILVLSVDNGKLTVVAEKETRGAVYNLNAFNGKLLAGINQKVQIFKWVARDDGSKELQTECSHYGHILAVYVKCRGDFILVGDVMKSMSLLQYKPEEGAIEERARDFNANWMTAVEVLDDDTFLGAENNYNLFVVRKNGDAASDEERGRLEVVGEYHLGEFVNTFRHGSLVMRLPDTELADIPTVIFGTINGVIGVVASLPQELFTFLQRLQTAMTKVVKGVGGLNHDEWRSFSNDRKTVEAKGFVDGDLIESFLDLGLLKMREVAEKVGVPVEEISKKVEELTRLH